MSDSTAHVVEERQFQWKNRTEQSSSGRGQNSYGNLKVLAEENGKDKMVKFRNMPLSLVQNAKRQNDSWEEFADKYILPLISRKENEILKKVQEIEV